MLLNKMVQIPETQKLHSKTHFPIYFFYLYTKHTLAHLCIELQISNFLEYLYLISISSKFIVLLSVSVSKETYP